MPQGLKGALSLFGIIAAALVVGYLMQASPTLVPEALASEIRNTYSKGLDAPKVIVFSADYCPSCRALESDLKRSGIEYSRANIETDQVAQGYLVKLLNSNQITIPQTLVGNKLIRGYAPSEVRKALANLKIQGVS